jgi:hypothetical protein
MHAVTVFLLLLMAMVTGLLWRTLRRARRMDFIRREPLPKGLYEKLRQHRPALTGKDCHLVGQALRQFFAAYLESGGKGVSMPSQVVDELWHAFILHTRAYEAFCRQGFGRFLHHTPAVAMGGERRSNAGLRRVWWHCCRAENIDPRHPSRLPLLFAIDAKLQIEGGFRYVPDCRPLRRQAAGAEAGIAIHCGGDFTSSAFDGSTEGLGGDGGGGDGSSGDGGGCGGGGCSD